jgi:hypothetical protein
MSFQDIFITSELSSELELLLESPSNTELAGTSAKVTRQLSGSGSSIEAGCITWTMGGRTGPFGPFTPPGSFSYIRAPSSRLRAMIMRSPFSSRFTVGMVASKVLQ